MQVTKRLDCSTSQAAACFTRMLGTLCLSLGNREAEGRSVAKGLRLVWVWQVWGLMGKRPC
jgi:hypothetical protein